MATLVGKKKGNKTYFYLVESGRVEGRPRIVHQTYLGTAERIAALVREESAPTPLRAKSIEFGLPGALWLAATHSGVVELLDSIWPKPKRGPALSHYLIGAAIHRICAPGPKTEFAGWYQRSILLDLWKFKPERFSSQAFWDAFDSIQLDPIDASPSGDDQLERAQAALLSLWKRLGLISTRILSYDTTNFHTYIASTNQRNTLAQRGHNKQGRHNLRQVGLAYLLDGTHGISLGHHVYPGDRNDTDEFSYSLPRLLDLLDQGEVPRSGVTFVFDKGTASFDNTIALDFEQVGWIQAVPWDQAPKGFREREASQLQPLGPRFPGVSVALEQGEWNGPDRQLVLIHSSCFLSEQLHGLTTDLAKATANLASLAKALRKNSAQFTVPGVRKRIDRWINRQFVRDLFHYELSSSGRQIELAYSIDTHALNRLIAQRLGRTVLATNRTGWSADELVQAWSAQQTLERVFRGFKGGDWLTWNPMFHWTDSKIRVHAFYCMLGVTLLNYVRHQIGSAAGDLTLERMIEELDQIRQVLLFYPPQGGRGPARTARVQTPDNITQQILLRSLRLDSLTAAR